MVSSTSPKRAAGWAMMTTPMRATTAAVNWILVNCWPRNTWQDQAVTRGMRKRKTVASARGR